MADGVKVILRILEAANGKQDVAALLVPRHFAYRLIDELYPVRMVRLDLYADRSICDKREEERARYRKLVSDGGYVGKIFNYPMVVADDVVICSLTKDDLVLSAKRLGIDVEEVMSDRNG